MTNDDLDRTLREWADATDPASDPITGNDVRAAASDPSPVVGIESARGRSRRLPWIAVAAALVLVVGGSAVWRLNENSDGPEKVATDPTAPVPTQKGADTTGVPTQIVIDAPLSSADPDAIHRFAVLAGCTDGECASDGSVAPLATGRMWKGTSLVLNSAVPPGALVVRYETFAACVAGSCVPEGEDGRPDGFASVEALASCDAIIDSTASPTRAVVHIGYPSDGDPDCSLEIVDAFPALTVPPAWSVRANLPWDCGAGAWDAGSLIWRDPEATRSAFACLSDKFEQAEPVELRTSEIQANDSIRLAWYRVPVGRTAPVVEIIRSPVDLERGSWTIQRCSGLAFSNELLRTPEFSGCGSEETMSLDLPVLEVPDEPRDSSPSGLSQLVIDAADLPSGEEGIIHRWVLDVGGDEAASGRVNEGVALVIDDAGMWGSGDVELAWEMYDCLGSCPTVGPDGKPVDEAEPFEVCSAEPSDVETEGEVLVFRLRAGTCSVSSAKNVPEITVPPAWTLRAPFPSACGSDLTAGLPDPLYPGAPSPSRAPRECLVRVSNEGGSVELSSAERIGDASRPIVYRVGADGIDLIHPPHAGDESWTSQRCTGLEALGEPPWIAPTGCGDEEPMSLDPP